MSGASHHRSVRSVLAVIAARERRGPEGPTPGLVAVVVIRSPDVPVSSDPAGERGGARQPPCLRDVGHTLRRGSDSFALRDGVWITNVDPDHIDRLTPANGS